jgi:hypothetical protein
MPTSTPATAPTEDQWENLVSRAWEQFHSYGYEGELCMDETGFKNALNFILITLISEEYLADNDETTAQS